MPENFFERWSRRKAQQYTASKPEAEERAQREDEQLPGPTLNDVAELDAESDYSLFVAKGVDKHVRRAALKKMFSDPHFNTMDGLDIYIDDYTKPSPLSTAMLAALSHAQSTLSPQSAYPRHRAPDERGQTDTAPMETHAAPADADNDEAMEMDETHEDAIRFPLEADLDGSIDHHEDSQALPPTSS